MAERQPQHPHEHRWQLRRHEAEEIHSSIMSAAGRWVVIRHEHEELALRTAGVRAARRTRVT
jgi:hypothetical protein